jgi:hypothetical protein
VRTPCLVLAGNDEAHPYPISEELSRLIPNCEFIAEWKTGAALTAAKARVKEFLTKHTPERAWSRRGRSGLTPTLSADPSVTGRNLYRYKRAGRASVANRH